MHGSWTKTLPERVQLRRTKGWRMPPNTVKVDRTTIYGNPFRADGDDPCGFLPGPAVDAFRRWLTRVPGPGEAVTQRARLLAGLPKLRGKNLACWCRIGAPCHADVLLEIANSEETPCKTNE